MKLRTGFLRTQTNTSGVPRVMYRTGLSTVRLRGGGAAGHQVFTLFLASEAETPGLTHSVTSQAVARQGPLSMGFPSKILEAVAISSSREVKLRTSD